MQITIILPKIEKKNAAPNEYFLKNNSNNPYLKPINNSNIKFILKNLNNF
jgi:hypothetical protein